MPRKPADATPRGLRRKPRILFVGTDDARYSQIAKAFMRKQGGDVVDVASAGLRSSTIDPQVAAVMDEAGCDIRKETPRLVGREVLTWADMVITLAPAGEKVPVAVPGSAHHKHWRVRHALPEKPVTDPALYRACRDELRRRIDQTVRTIRLFRGR
jgi:arsenate reductase